MKIYTNYDVEFIIMNLCELSYNFAYKKIIRPYLSQLNYKKKDLISFIKYMCRYITKYNENIINSKSYISFNKIIHNDINIIYEKNGISIDLIKKIRQDLIPITINYWINQNNLNEYDYISVMIRKITIDNMMMYSDTIYYNKKSSNLILIVDLFVLFFFLYRFPGYFEPVILEPSTVKHIPIIPDFYDIMIFAKKDKKIDVISPNYNCLQIVYDMKDSMLMQEYNVDKFLIEYNYYQNNHPNKKFVCVFTKDNNIIKHVFNNYIQRGDYNE